MALSPLSSWEIGGLHGELAAIAVIGVAYVSLALLGWVVFALGTRVVQRRRRRARRRDRPHARAGARLRRARLRRHPVPRARARRAARRDAPAARAAARCSALLALAGLLRPEAWLFSAVYVCGCCGPACARPRAAPVRGARPPGAMPRRCSLLAASGPLLWALHDLLLTGDPLHSLTGTRDNAALLGRVTGIEHVPTAVPRRLGEILREPVLLAAAGGGVLALAWRRDRRVRLGRGRRAARARRVLRAGRRGPADHHPLPAAERHAAGDLRRRRGLRLARPAAAAASAPGGRASRRSRSSHCSCSSPARSQRIDRLGNALARQEAIQGELGDLVAGERLPRAGRGAQPAPDPAAGAVARARPRRSRRRAGDGCRQRGSYLVPGNARGRARLHPRPPRSRPADRAAAAAISPRERQRRVATLRVRVVAIPVQGDHDTGG